MTRQVLSFFILLFSLAVVAQVKPLPNAHAHNDYEHARPLWDALAQGFMSVEADVHLINGELYVSHNSPKELKSALTLKELYLRPLREIVSRNEGKVYPKAEGVFYLMIDFKTSADATYEVLAAQLAQFPELQTNPYVVIFISGNRPVETIRNASSPAALLDGRPEDLAKNIPTNRMPVISENFNKVCRWNGKMPVPDAEFQKLKTLATQVHAQGKKLRLWATPDHPDAWKTLLEAGVDLINTDKLEELRKFLESNPN
jgi:glycerophosphoryl diester phosphodiesterase